MKRPELLDQAKAIVTQDRTNEYGSLEDNFQVIADLWTVIFRNKLRDGEAFTAADVSRGQIQVKQARLAANQEHMDSWVDTAGYSACGAELASRSDEQS